MILYHVDGFDLVDYPRVFLKYNGYTSQFDQGQMTAGNGGGNAFVSFNSAFSVNGGQWTKILGSSVSQLGVHLDYRQFGGSTFSTWDFFKVSVGSTDLLTVHQRGDGHLQFFGPLSGLIATTVNPIVLGAWSNIVMLLSFGVTGSLQVFINGVNALAVAIEPANFGSSNPDRATFFFNAGFGPPGITIDNYFLFDGASNPGPCHVDSLLPIADSPSTVWIPAVTSPAVITPSCTGMVNDVLGRFPGEGPDGDFSYMIPSVAGNQSFQMAASRCYGLVLGVALNACGRPNTGFSPQQFNFVVQLSAGLQVVGTGTLVNVGAIASDPHLTDYQTVQALMPTSPATGGNWVDAEITNGAFGVGSIELQQRITAFNLEKITSLTPQPFSCGGASYSY